MGIFSGYRQQASLPETTSTVEGITARQASERARIARGKKEEEENEEAEKYIIKNDLKNKAFQAIEEAVDKGNGSVNFEVKSPAIGRVLVELLKPNGFSSEVKFSASHYVWIYWG